MVVGYARLAIDARVGRSSENNVREVNVPTASWHLFFLIIALVALGPVSTDLYLPALPALVVGLQTDVARGQLTLTAYLIGFALGQLAYGPLSDRYGRRPVILGGLALYALATLACWTAPNIETLLIARVVQAVGAGVGPVLGRAIVRDVYGPHEAARMLAIVGSVMAIAPALAPVVGGAIVSMASWRATFLALEFYVLLVLLAAFLWLPETNAHRGAHVSLNVWHTFVPLWRDPRFRYLMLANASGYAALFAFISGSSFVFIGMFGFTPLQMAAAFALMVSGYFAGSVTSARLARRWGAERLLRLGGHIGGLAGVAMLVWTLTAPSPAAIIVPMWCCGVAAGLLMPNATGLALAPYPHLAGSAAAFIGFTQMGVAALAGTLVGHLLAESALPMVAVIAAVMLGGWRSSVLGVSQSTAKRPT